MTTEKQLEQQIIFKELRQLELLDEVTNALKSKPATLITNYYRPTTYSWHVLYKLCKLQNCNFFLF